MIIKYKMSKWWASEAIGMWLLTLATIFLFQVSQAYRLQLGLTESFDSSEISATDSCDWTSSGLGHDFRSVIPIYLNCATGKVKWHHPTSGLHVVLSRGETEFRGCIKISKNVTSQVRIYIEGNGSLSKLYDSSLLSDVNSSDRPRCFVSTNSKVALYLEPLHHGNHSVGSLNRPQVKNSELFEFSYHLEPVSSSRALQDESLDMCRPCSDEELTSLFCSSDFVLSGHITSMQHIQDLDRTELSIRVTDLKRDSIPSLLTTNRNRFSKSHNNNKQSKSSVIILHRPLKCHSKAGLGSEFLFLGRWVLGNPVIQCAPKLSYWKHAKHRSLVSGTNQCKLEL